MHDAAISEPFATRRSTCSVSVMRCLLAVTTLPQVRAAQAGDREILRLGVDRVVAVE